MYFLTITQKKKVEILCTNKILLNSNKTEIFQAYLYAEINEVMSVYFHKSDHQTPFKVK